MTQQDIFQLVLHISAGAGRTKSEWRLQNVLSELVLVSRYGQEVFFQNLQTGSVAQPVFYSICTGVFPGRKVPEA